MVSTKLKILSVITVFITFNMKKMERIKKDAPINRGVFTILSKSEIP